MNPDLLKEIEAFAKSYYNRIIPNHRIWVDHIRLVRKFAIELAEIEGARKDVVEIAAILHDIGKIEGNEDHGEISYRISKEFLEKADIIDVHRSLILKCILRHSSKYANEENEIEVKIIQSADALAVLYDEKWQEKSKKRCSKIEYQELLEKTFSKINIPSARKMASLQLEKL